MNIFTLLILLPLINSYYFHTPIIHNDLHGYSYRYNYSCLFTKKKGQEQDKNVKITPKTPGQQVYWNNLKNNNIKILLGIGPAGTGKTFLACQYAIQMLHTNNVDRIILTRPLVSTDEELGFLPGNLMKKMEKF
jgi:phosphate starvation-inducible protein PhoH